MDDAGVVELENFTHAPEIEVAGCDDGLHLRYMELVSDARAILVERARAILADDPMLKEFVCTHGQWFFVTESGATMTGYYKGCCRAARWARPVADFVAEWDQYLKLTGSPMRFTATGPIITEW